MACTQDSPSSEEEYRQHTAQLYIHLCRKLELTPPLWVTQAAAEAYCGEKHTAPALCNLLDVMGSAEIDTLVYNGRDPMARKLADWWDEYKANDRGRKAYEGDEAIKRAALAKLTPKERKVLGY